MKVWSLRWNTLSNRSILAEVICKENIDQASITEICNIQGIFATKAAQYSRIWKLAKGWPQNLIIICSNDFFSFADKGLL